MWTTIAILALGIGIYVEIRAAVRTVLNEIVRIEFRLEDAGLLKKRLERHDG